MNTEDLWEENTDYCFVCGAEHSYMSGQGCICGCNGGFTKPTEGEALMRLAERFHKVQGGGSAFRLAEDCALYVYPDSRLDGIVDTLLDQIEAEELALATAKNLLATLRNVKEGRNDPPCYGE